MSDSLLTLPEQTPRFRAPALLFNVTEDGVRIRHADACQANADGIEQAQLGIGCDFRGDVLVVEGGGESGQGA